MEVFEKTIINQISIREQVENILLNMILNGELKGDEPISVRQIAALLNVSATPVKEAFRTLESEGFLYTQPRKGTVVCSFPEDMAKQIVYIRSYLESVAARFAAEHITAEEIRDARAMLKKANELLKEQADPRLSEEAYKKNLTDLYNINTDFHLLISRAAKNDYLFRIIIALRSIQNYFRIKFLEGTLDSRINSCIEHENILNAIEKRDGDKAEELVKQHLLAILRFVPETSQGQETE